MTVGVLLMTYGAPRDDADVRRYLESIRGGPPSAELASEFRRRYAAIGGSPLVEITERQADALERELRRDRSEWRVLAAMRHSPPFVREQIAVLARSGLERLVGIVLSPQWSERLMAGYVRALEGARGLLPPEVEVRLVRGWYREPAFIEAIAERLREALARLGPDAGRARVVLTAHSLPRSVFETEPEYVAALQETAELVASRAGLAPEHWVWAYQSAGHTAEEWLRPDLKELFPAIARGGSRHVLVVPVQFLADHLEVLYDLDIAAAEEAHASGLAYHRIEMPNTQPSFIRALALVARSALAPEPVAG